MGVGEAMADKKVIENAVSDMQKISGQKPLVTLARKSIANFKVRENWPIGCKVTLRRAHMYEFLDRFISIAVPRMRDFRGLSARSFDGQATTRWASRNRLFFRRSISTRSTRSVAWTSRLPRPPKPTRRRVRCSRPSTSRSGADVPWQRNR